ncbi:MAG: Fe-S-containing hydro-lyase [Clostridia bacterium]|jgi:fumarate hydratase subunit beta|nr:Fe-S-containing hydro-lyase [Clostridia bacterium]
MPDIKRINTPITDIVIEDLKAGDMVAITGVIYTGRDAAHKRLIQTYQEGKELPIEIKGQIIYYVGPCPAKPGQALGSCGPTTSFRMDAYTPALLELGLKGMIGKGPRAAAVVDSMQKNNAVYFAAIGGAGASIARSVKKADIVAYQDLGPEAIYRLEVEDFPAIVVIDSAGNDQYKIGPQQYKIDLSSDKTG